MSLELWGRERISSESQATTLAAILCCFSDKQIPTSLWWLLCNGSQFSNFWNSWGDTAFKRTTAEVSHLSHRYIFIDLLPWVRVWKALLEYGQMVTATSDIPHMAAAALGGDATRDITGSVSSKRMVRKRTQVKLGSVSQGRQPILNNPP